MEIKVKIEASGKMCGDCKYNQKYYNTSDGRMLCHCDVYGKELKPVVYVYDRPELSAGVALRCAECLESEIKADKDVQSQKNEKKK